MYPGAKSTASIGERRILPGPQAVPLDNGSAANPPDGSFKSCESPSVAIALEAIYVGRQTCFSALRPFFALQFSPAEHAVK